MIQDSSSQNLQARVGAFIALPTRYSEEPNNALKNNAVAIILYCLNEFTERNTEINKLAYDFAIKILDKNKSNLYVKKGVRVSEIKLSNLVVGK